MQDSVPYKFIIVVLVILCLTIAVTFTVTSIGLIKGSTQHLHVTNTKHEVPNELTKPHRKSKINRNNHKYDDSYVEKNEIVLQNLYYILGYQEGLLNKNINPNAIDSPKMGHTHKPKLPITTEKDLTWTNYMHKKHPIDNNPNVLLNEYVINLDDPKIKEKNYDVYFSYNTKKSGFSRNIINRNSHDSEYANPICSYEKKIDAPEYGIDIYDKKYKIVNGNIKGVEVKQEVNVEECTFENTALKEEIESVTGYKVICYQIHSHVPLLAFDHNNRTMETHFKINCCCQCKLSK